MTFSFLIWKRGPKHHTQWLSSSSFREQAKKILGEPTVTPGNPS